MKSDVLDYYHPISETHSLPKLTRTGLHYETETVTGVARIFEKVREFEATQGWIQFQSAVVAFSAAPLPIAQGVVLAAECVNAAGVSLHVRHIGSDNWIISRYRREAATDGQGKYIVQRCMYLCQQKSLGKICYDLYYARNDEQGYIPAFSCFTGYSRE